MQTEEGGEVVVTRRDLTGSKSSKNKYFILILPHTDLSLLLQEGFAPPEDEEIDEGAQGDQEEF